MHHEVSEVGLLDPPVFQAIRRGPVEVTVIGPRTVEFKGTRFTVDAPDTILLTPFERVWIFLNRNFYLVTETERVEQQRQREAFQAQRLADQQARDKARKAQADAFNASLQVPARWVPGIKPVLSGLSERSAGNGVYASTVVHIYLQEALEEGRLVRGTHDFLCTSAAGTNGKQWTSCEEEIMDSNREVYRPAVTCRACLKLARRWQVESRVGEPAGK